MARIFPASVQSFSVYLSNPFFNTNDNKLLKIDKKLLKNPKPGDILSLKEIFISITIKGGRR